MSQSDKKEKSDKKKNDKAAKAETSPDKNSKGKKAKAQAESATKPVVADDVKPLPSGCVSSRFSISTKLYEKELARLQIELVKLQE